MQLLQSLPPRPTGRSAVVGLTGGIGVGKSQLASCLEDLGARLIDADSISRQSLEPNNSANIQVQQVFGKQIADHLGYINRDALAAIVFSDPDKLAQLEAIIHPIVRKHTGAIVSMSPPSEVILYDVPLLIEKSWHYEVDMVLVVDAPLELRLERLERRGLARAAALARIELQATDEQRRAAAHLWVDNNQDGPAILNIADHLWEEYLRPLAPAWP